MYTASILLKSRFPVTKRLVDETNDLFSDLLSKLDGVPPVKK